MTPPAKWTADLPEPRPRPPLALSTVGRSSRAKHRAAQKRSKSWQTGAVRLAAARKGER